jgi:uncharacterized iron-regulated membrane protein
MFLAAVAATAVWLIRRFLAPLLRRLEDRYKGTRVGALIAGSIVLILGGLALFQVLRAAKEGETFCAFRHCNKTVALGTDSNLFWSSVIAWSVVGLAFVFFSAYAFWFVWKKKSPP